jgi:hypothetical protein
MRAVRDLSPVSHFGRPAKRADEDRHPRRKTRKEFNHVHDMLSLRLPHGLCPFPEGQLADLATLHQC